VGPFHGSGGGVVLGLVGFTQRTISSFLRKISRSVVYDVVNCYNIMLIFNLLKLSNIVVWDYIKLFPCELSKLLYNCDAMSRFIPFMICFRIIFTSYILRILNLRISQRCIILF